jgi:hypothetical protein
MYDFLSRDGIDWSLLNGWEMRLKSLAVYSKIIINVMYSKLPPSPSSFSISLRFAFIFFNSNIYI